MVQTVDQMMNNQNGIEQAKLRKYEHTLAISGVGVMAFGIWSVIKAAIYYILVPVKEVGRAFYDMTMLPDEAAVFSDKSYGYLAISGIMLFLLIDLLLRLYIGRAAFQDGRKIRRRRITYVIAAMFVTVGAIASPILEFFAFGSDTASEWNQMVDTGSVSVIIELTSLLVLIELIVSAIMVRKLRKRLYVSEEEMS